MPDTCVSRRYAEKVAKLANGATNDPLYTGKHLKDLSEYLERPSKRTTERSKYSPDSGPLIWFYDLNGGNFPCAQPFYHVSDYEEGLKTRDRDHGILFLTGNPTSEWLNAVSGEFNLDPYYLLEHLRFQPTVALDTYSHPAIPSTARNVLRLTVPTIGHIEPAPHIDNSDLQEYRRIAAKKVKERHRGHLSCSAGSPIVRDLFIHDAHRFTIEQDITITLAEHGKTWTLIILCDSGTSENPDVENFLNGIRAYLGCDAVLTPIVQPARRRIWQPNDSNENPSVKSNPTHTLALLPSHYGKLLNANLAAQDPFYALWELLDLVASAELQFVNMMSNLIQGQIELASQGDKDGPSLADFQHSRYLLERHLLGLGDSKSFLEDRDGSGWPLSTSTNDRHLASETNTALLKKFQYLITRTSKNIHGCDRGVDILLNNANVQIAIRTFDHSHNLGQLTSLGTWIAILFVPLSFLTSIYGMNFREFGQGELSLWIYAATAGPLFITSALIACFWKRLRALYRQLFAKDR